MKLSFLISQHNRLQLKGFTLAELLIALAILGVIAAFTIPKVLQTIQTNQCNANLKETFSAVSGVIYNGWTQGLLKSGYNGRYILQNLNAIKICSANSSTEGCWTQSDPSGVGGESTQPGVVMPNGVTIAGLDDYANPDLNSWIMDCDGSQGSNTEGIDQIRLRMCFGSTAACGLKAGTLYAHPWYPTSITMWNQVFQN